MPEERARSINLNDLAPSRDHHADQSKQMTEAAKILKYL